MNSNCASLNLKIIAAIDSICYGLIYSFISPYVLTLGGDFVTVGLLSVGILLGELISEDVTKIFTHLHGKRYSLFVIFNVAMVTHLMLIFTTCYWFTILARILFSMTNQSQNLIKDLLLQRGETQEDKDHLIWAYNILSVVGYIIGPIISGYLFDFGFLFTAILAAMLTFINIGLLVQVPKGHHDENPEHNEKSVFEKSLDNVKNNIENLKTSDYDKNWDLIAVKFLFTASISVFFSKFTHILKHNYSSSSIRIGYTISYINFLIFIATFFIPDIKEKYKNYPTIILTEILMLVFGILIIFITFAPIFEIFLLLCIPTIFVRSYMISACKELFKERQNNSLVKINNSISVVAGIITPILFGFLCNLIQHNAVRIFSILPVICCWYIIKTHTKACTLTEDKKEE